MQSATETAPVSKKTVWAGRIISALPVLFLLFDGVAKLIKPAPVVEAQFGPDIPRASYPVSESSYRLYCRLCRSAYGRARCDPADRLSRRGDCYPRSHWRSGLPDFVSEHVGVLIWGGLFLRDKRLRELIPLRS